MGRWLGFDELANRVTEWAGSGKVSLAAFLCVFVWVIGGFLVGFTDTYQLIINTGTTIVTFLMVFLIQHTQNRNERALHLKLDEIIKRTEGPRNELAGVEKRTEAELEALEESENSVS